LNTVNSTERNSVLPSASGDSRTSISYAGSKVGRPGSLVPALNQMNQFDSNPKGISVSRSVQNLERLDDISKTNMNVHNPIVNPIPINIQNPYMLKELYKANTRLASVASSNLIKA
jgi:hypothetical protein